MDKDTVRLLAFSDVHMSGLYRDRLLAKWDEILIVRTVKRTALAESEGTA